ALAVIEWMPLHHVHPVLGEMPADRIGKILGAEALGSHGRDEGRRPATVWDIKHDRVAEVSGRISTTAKCDRQGLKLLQQLRFVLTLARDNGIELLQLRDPDGPLQFGHSEIEAVTKGALLPAALGRAVFMAMIMERTCHNKAMLIVGDDKAAFPRVE